MGQNEDEHDDSVAAALRNAGAAAMRDSVADRLRRGIREEIIGTGDVADPHDRFPSSNRFALVQALGRGGMGVVYEAIDCERNVRVALKTLSSAKPLDVLRFKDEFRTLRDLRHPNLVTLGELFEDDGAWYFTMELVRGQDFLLYSRASPSDTRVRDEVTTLRDSPSGDATSPEVDTADISLIPELAGRRFDEARLRTALAGLVRGLAALHRAGVVHRDVKPSNILVQQDARVVLLDFGVAAAIGEARTTAEQNRSIVGTVQYMAPEQARGEIVGPAADLYAVGVLLFQAMTGRLPFEGRNLQEVLVRKGAMQPPHPAMFARDLPSDLQDLAVALLARDAAERPGVDEVLEQLTRNHTRDPEHVLSPPPLQFEPLFVGRTRELAQLEDAFDESRDIGAECVLVEGESGVGKSALVAQFIQHQRADDASLVVLRGRCHERERVPYNAFDGVVDDLTRYLSQRRTDKVERLAPTPVGPLLHVFPALRAVGAFATIAKREPNRESSADVRRDAFVGLRALLGELAKRRPLIVALDDVQWADSDSALLLDALLRPADGLRALFIMAARPTEGGRMPLADLVPAGTRPITLTGLRRPEAEELVRSLNRRFPPVEGTDPGTIFEETAGHPLFIDELVRHLARSSAPSGPLRLDDALCSRVDALSEDSRRLLHVVAAASAPVAQAPVAAAAGLTASRYGAAVGTLTAAGLVRISGARPSDTIEPFHDRVREAVYRNLHAGVRRALHARLARCLETHGAGADVLFVHFDAAGEREQAARYTIAAARTAATAHAFGRAAELYKKALDGGDHTRDQRRDLLAELGYALQNDGRAPEAADAFLNAASLAPDEISFDLRQRAAGLYLMSGHLDRGLQTAAPVLAEVGMKIPGNRLSTLLRVLWNRSRLDRHPLVWEVVRDNDLDPVERARPDLCWSMFAGLAMVDMYLSAYFGSRGSLLALRCGEPMRITRGLFASVIGAIAMGRVAEAKRLLESVRRAAQQADSEQAVFYVQLAQAVYDFLLENDWSTALAGLREAERLWHRSGRGPGWETDVTLHLLCSSLAFLGREPEVVERVRDHLRRSRGRGNLLSEVSLRVRFGWLSILDDDPEYGEADIADALSSWQPGQDLHGNQHLWALWSRSRLALYRGNISAVWPTLEPDWRRLRRSLVSRMAAMKAEWVWWYACLQIALAKEHWELDARRARAHLKEAERWVSRMEKFPVRVSSVGSVLLRAGVANVRGDQQKALHLLHHARPLVAQHVPLYRDIVDYRIGTIVGGQEGAAISMPARESLAVRGYANPARFAAMLPGWAHPAQ